MSAHHPDDMNLLNYTAGNLSAAQALAVTMHLCACHNCRTHIKKLNNVGGALLDKITPASNSDAEFDALLSRLEPHTAYAQQPQVGTTSDRNNAHTLGAKSDAITEAASTAEYRNPLTRFLPAPLKDLPWQRQSSEISMFDLSSLINDDGFQVRLQKINAGARVPKHTHKGFEYTVILAGGFSDELGVYHSGDFIERDSQHYHSPTALQNEDCICLTVLNAPLKFTGWQRIFNPFMAWH